MAKNRRSIAAKYLERVDSGLAFSTDEVSGWSPSSFAEERVRGLCDQHLVLTWQRVRVLKVEKVTWWEKARSALRPSIYNLSWRVLELGMPAAELWGGLEKEYVSGKELSGAMFGEVEYVLPKPGTKEGKRLALAAVSLQPEKWIHDCVAELEYLHRYVPTIAQAALHSEPEVQASLCNKLIHCLDIEFARVRKLQEQLDEWC